MELLHMALLVLSFTALLQFLVSKLRKSSAHPFPPSPPGSWPLLGHLPFLSTAGCLHHVLARLARPSPTGLGPMIGLRLGSKLGVVVCNSHLAKEVLHTHDKLLANRPYFLFTDFVYYGYDTSIGFSSYSPRWATRRKLFTSELFTLKRLQALQHLRYQEVRGLLESLLQESNGGTQAVDLGASFRLMLCNSIGRVLHSKTVAEAGGQPFGSMLSELEEVVVPTIGDFLPWLKVLDLLPKRAMKKSHDRMDKIIETIISQRRQLMKSCKAEELPQDLLQGLLSKEAINQQQSMDQDDLLTIKEIKGIIFEVLTAGTHTTAQTLEWAMAELLRNPDCLRKLRDEIDAVLGKGDDHQFVTDEDIAKLAYLDKVVKEVFRLHPLAPLLAPHVASEAVQVDKYTLPEGTLFMVNAWAIGRDPDVWEKPEEFIPERFDGKDMDVRGQHYDLLPFGSGRRGCPAIRLALSVLHVTLANLVRTFEWELPHGQTWEEIDMSEKGGITSMRMKPLLAIPKPRLGAFDLHLGSTLSIE